MSHIDFRLLCQLCLQHCDLNHHIAPLMIVITDVMRNCLALSCHKNLSFHLLEPHTCKQIIEGNKNDVNVLPFLKVKPVVWNSCVFHCNLLSIFLHFLLCLRFFHSFEPFFVTGMVGSSHNLEIHMNSETLQDTTSGRDKFI